MLNIGGTQGFARATGGDVDPQAYLNADQRGGGGPNGKPSMTIDQAGLHLIGGEPGWSSALGLPYTVTYGFRSSAPFVMPSDTGGFSRFSAAQIAQTELALLAWSDVANITFVRVGSGTGANAYSNSASILLANYATGEAGSAAFGNYPGDPSFSSQSGDVWVNSTLSYNRSPVQGNYGALVLVHELGHAIGLAHPGKYNAEDGVTITYDHDAEYYEDSLQYTVMSYFDEKNTGADYHGAYAASPLLDDISAAQKEYGVNLTTRTSDTVYGFNSTADRPWFAATSASSKLIFAAWDAGGVDTFDFSGFGSAQTIDLREGYFSSVGGLVGNVVVAEGAAIENAIGGSGSDVITGNALSNSLSGGGGADTLNGLGGANIFDGGEGDDILNGGDGIDTAVYSRSTGMVIVDLGLTGRQNTQSQGYDTLSSIENLIGSNYGDGLAGNALANIIDGGQGQDYMAGGGGDDTYFVDSAGDNPVESLNAGYDAVISQVDFALNVNLEALTLVNGQNGVGNALDNMITGNAGANNLQGWDGSDQLHGLGGGDLIYGQSGVDFLYGDDGDDTLDGGDAGDALLGGNGDDLLIGGAGQDWMEGGAGNDRYIVQDIGDNPLEAFGAGNDTVYSYVSVTLGDNIETLWLTGAGALDGVGSDQANNLYGNADANNLLGRGGADTIAGFEGDDTLVGGDGADLLDGAAGADRLYGDDGNDTLNAGDGNDLLVGGLGADVMTGGLGDDIYVVDSASDQTVEIAGQGADTVYSTISLTLAPNLERLLLVGPDPVNGTGNSIDNGVVGNEAANVLSGLGGNDYLLGYGGADLLYGGFESDFLNGGAGDDVLIGGGGRDLLYGEAGADLFRFESVADSRFNGPNDDRDAIMDFTVGVDKVELRPVHLSGLDTFRLILDASGTAQLLQVDQGGDGTIDMEILLFNVTNATNADILW